MSVHSVCSSGRTATAAGLPPLALARQVSRSATRARPHQPMPESARPWRDSAKKTQLQPVTYTRIAKAPPIESPLENSSRHTSRGAHEFSCAATRSVISPSDTPTFTSAGGPGVELVARASIQWVPVTMAPDELGSTVSAVPWPAMLRPRKDQCQALVRQPKAWAVAEIRPLAVPRDQPVTTPAARIWKTFRRCAGACSSVKCRRKTATLPRAEVTGARPRHRRRQKHPEPDRNRRFPTQNRQAPQNGVEATSSSARESGTPRRSRTCRRRRQDHRPQARHIHHRPATSRRARRNSPLPCPVATPGRRHSQPSPARSRSRGTRARHGLPDSGTLEPSVEYSTSPDGPPIQDGVQRVPRPWCCSASSVASWGYTAVGIWKISPSCAFNMFAS